MGTTEVPSNAGRLAAELAEVAGYTFGDGTDRTEGRACVQDKQQALDRFLSEVERAAYRMAEIATRNPDDALDIVQDAMFKLVEKYSDKPEEEWRPLFFRILHSRITDYHRRGSLTGRIFSWISDDMISDGPEAPTHIDGPLEKLTEALTIEQLTEALANLPHRQQQVFMLRTWQGFSVAETAKMLKCTEGSIKTYLSRATEALMKSIAAPEDADDQD